MSLFLALRQALLTLSGTGLALFRQIPTLRLMEQDNEICKRCGGCPVYGPADLNEERFCAWCVEELEITRFPSEPAMNPYV